MLIDRLSHSVPTFIRIFVQPQTKKSEKIEKKPIPEALMYRETRKRKTGRAYKISAESSEQNIDGKFVKRCAKKMKNPSKPGILIPDEFLLPCKAQVVKDTIKEVMRVFKQICPEKLDSLGPFFDDPSGVI